MSDDPLPPLPPRDPAGHKGTFGTVAIVGGCAGGGSVGASAGGSGERSPRATDPPSGSVPHVTAGRMIGGPALSALAALRAGAGLVRLVMPAPVLDAGLVIAPSATGLAIPVDAASGAGGGGGGGAIIAHESARIIDELSSAVDCLAIGPGLGVSAGARALCLRAVQQQETPLVLDADALNNLADIPHLHEDFHAAAVLTPHPGEFRRLAIAVRLGGDGAAATAPGAPLDPTNDATRPAAAESLARALGCIVILKGARTVVTDGHRTWTNDGPDSGAANPALAVAGSGDVLTGLLAALIAWLHPRRDTRRRTILQDLARKALEARGSRLAGATLSEPRTSAHSEPRTSVRAASSSTDSPSEPPPSFSLFDCSRLAVRAHADAASLWRERHAGASGGMLASELADLLPEALEQMRG